MKENTLNLKKIIIVAVICVMAYFIMTILSIYMLKDATISKSDNHLVESNKLGAKFAASVLNRKLHSIEHILTLKQSGNMKKDMEYLKSIKENSDLDILGYAATDGVMHSVDNDIFIVTASSFYERAMQGKQFIDVYNGEETGYINYLIMALPYMVNGQVQGVIVGGCEVNKIAREILFSFEKGNGYSVIVDKRGKSLIYLDTRANNNNIYDDLSAVNNEAKVNNFANRINNIEENESVEEFKVGEDKQFLAGSKLNFADWTYISGVSKNSVYSSYTDILQMQLILLGIMSTIIFMVAKYIYDEKRKENVTINKLAYQDKVSLIGNENKLVMQIENVLKTRPDKKYLIAYFDVDNFGFINDTYNYEFGNQVLREIGSALVKILGEKGIYARIANDNFAFFYEYSKDKDEIEKVVNALNKEMNIFRDKNNMSFNILLSFGVYILQKDKTQDVKKMLSNANIARTKVKSIHNYSFAYYDSGMKAQLVEEKEIINDLITAINENQFVVYYQPKVYSSTQSIAAAEALVRWKHPVKGLIYPDKFIYLAEKTHDIVKIDRWVFKEVCKTIRSWQDNGEKVVPISVNVSRIELYEIDFLEYIDKVIEETGVNTEYIEIEITESVTLNDTGYVQDIIKKLRERKIKISMDDFGTGYSSLACLKNLKLDVLKLDRSFVIDIDTNKESENLVKSVVYLAKNLNMEIVCEGVDSFAQVSKLRDLGCDLIQGYVYFKPLTLEDFRKAIKLEELRDTMI
ncbi:MAG: EAL domain-containing protein [Clostridia bacterium]